MSAEKPVEAPAAEAEKLWAAIRFEKGNPSSADVAAIVTVLAAAAGSTPQAGVELKSLWGDNRERMRPQYFNGPNAFTSQTPLFWTKGS
ncbi:acyl-CoA carboxylase subunit epsilon [Tsukamurella sp. 1534]|uniref:acyl-CoA carboxylase subunit epsilon n=1 Tax=Tsukamurella sp. 1534 TaxID=1151061 RepID=UPI0002E29A56|nr:acyl-CoA carboxylase subunit epsilon [Tsukamurella sp. 1534]